MVSTGVSQRGPWVQRLQDSIIFTCTVGWCISNYSYFLCLCLSTACNRQCLNCESAAGCTSCRDPAKVLLFGECQYESCAQQYYLDFSTKTCRGEKHIAGLKKKKSQVAWPIIRYIAARSVQVACFKMYVWEGRCSVRFFQFSSFSAVICHILQPFSEKQDYCKSFSCKRFSKWASKLLKGQVLEFI